MSAKDVCGLKLDQVAGILGATILETPHGNVSMKMKEKHGLAPVLWFRMEKGRLCVHVCEPKTSGSYETRKQWEQLDTSAKLSPDKTAEQLARDILRRFDWESIYAIYECYATDAMRERERENAQDRFCDQVAEITGKPRVAPQYRRDRESWYLSKTDHVSNTVEIEAQHARATVTIRDVTPEQLRVIWEMVTSQQFG